MKRIISAFLADKVAIAVLSACIAVIAAFASLSSVFTGQFIDAVSRHDYSGSAHTLEAITVLGLAFVAGWTVSDGIAARLAERMGLSLRLQLVRKVYRMPFAFFSGVQTAELENRLGGDISLLANTMYSAIVQAASAVLSLAFIAIAMVMLNWELAVISAALIPIWLIVAAKHRGSSRAAQHEHVEARDGFSTRVIEFLSVPGMIRTMSFGRREHDAFAFEQLAEVLCECSLKVKAAMRAQFATLSLAITITNVLTLVASLFLYSHGAISAGTIVSFIGFRTALQYYVNVLASVEIQTGSSEAIVEKIESLLAAEEQAVKAGLASQGAIVLDHVRFAYPESDRPAIDDVSLSISPGERVAIIGPSGSGKSTLALLMQGFYEASAGTVVLDGVPIQDLSEQNLRRVFGFSHALDRMLPGTIRENALYANDAASETHLWEAAKAASVASLIAALPDRLDAEIGNSVQVFSTGELQRLCLMRTFIKESEVLLLDEPTSALDAEIEAQILEALRALPQTLILITHRLSSVLEMDRVVVMDGGRIQEQGVPIALLRRRGRFYQMLCAQIGSRLVDALLERVEVA